MASPLTAPIARRPRAADGRPLRLAHLTTVDLSLDLLLATELAADVDAGFEVFGLSAPGPHVAAVESLGVRHIAIPALSRAWTPSSDLRAAAQLVTALRELDLDILHTHNPKTGVLGRLVGRALGLPVVVNTCHGLWLRPEDSFTRRAFVIGVEGIAARASHLELYQNDEDRQRLRRWVPAARSRLVGNGIDLTRFRPDAAARARVRQELGVSDAELLIGGVGRRVAEKGIAEFAAAARALRGRIGAAGDGDLLRFVWVGPDDPAKPDALRTAERGVEFHGERADMPGFYNALDVFVLPSYREGFSRSSMEAAATGLPLVLSDIRGCREIGTDGRDLLLVAPRDVGELTERLGRLVADPALRRRLGQASRQRALVTFDQLAVARASIEAYCDVATRRRLGWTEEC